MPLMSVNPYYITSYDFMLNISVYIYQFYNCRSFGRPILEYGASLWDLYKEKQTNILDLNKMAKFANQRNDSNWKTLVQCRKATDVSVLFKAYTGERACKAISDRLQKPGYLTGSIMLGKLGG
jgi:hypothetical protein